MSRGRNCSRCGASYDQYTHHCDATDVALFLGEKIERIEEVLKVLSCLGIPRTSAESTLLQYYTSQRKFHEE